MNGDPLPPTQSGSWQFKPDDQDPKEQSNQPVEAPPTASPDVADSDEAADASVPDPIPEKPPVTWTASEFIAHEKSPLWYLSLLVITAALATLVLLATHDKISTAVIVIVAIIFGATAGRQPRSLQYMVDEHGITVNRAFRAYSEFKSFAVVEEGAITSVIFLPIRRVALPLSVYIEPDDEEVVVKKLSEYLPMDQNHGHDAVDRLVQRLRF
jgi:hypothetical protein